MAQNKIEHPVSLPCVQMDSCAPPLPHIAIFPFMSKGHTIPMLHLAHLLHRRRLVSHITIFTTSGNAPFIHSSLSSIAAQSINIISLPFPDNLPPDIPTGVESTDHLPSIDLFLPFVTTIYHMRTAFSQAISQLSPPPSLLISDAFLCWTQYVATELNIPRLVFNGFGGFAQTISGIVATDKPHAEVTSPNESFAIPGFTHLSLTKDDLEPPFDDPDPKGPHWDFGVEQWVTTKASRGYIFNSFHELESPYFDYINSKWGVHSYQVGPLCMTRLDSDDKKNQSPSPLLQWLDSRLSLNRPVLYVAFGTQVKISLIQMKELATGLERSGLDFIWIIRAQECNWDDGFEERLRDRCRLVKEWVDQIEILAHKTVCGFITHCGWNSIMESMCTGVPVLAWPMMAEQRINAKFVVEELRMGLRIRASDGTKNGLVKAEDIERLTRELLVGEKGMTVKKKAEELAVAARKSMSEVGSSYAALEEMIVRNIN